MLALFRGLSKVGVRDATILEHNITQTAGSAGESLAFGIGVTMPAILILGFDLELTRVMLVAMLGGLLGILISVLITMLVGALVPALPSSVPFWALAAGFTVSVSVGVFFGVWPAMKAARLDPVEALRYE